ncbi:hypothetical protein RZ76_03100 [Apilactobacillus kunkeei]|uniref:hypothetical protein n=1 Tax=Apilactobacillus kunkeei TaxID=148814 RepID=UPI0006CE8801|nr:hypothetical protein [Apilactobacillus kunkeei]KPN80466.1 hypothetical protein RZ76_03100 [Apilactobacillus kunkeei]
MSKIDKYIDTNKQFSNNPDIAELSDYLDKYHLITEINALFLTVPDPSIDDDVKMILDSISKEDSQYMACAIVPVNGFESLKLIYDMNVYDSHEINDVAKLILDNSPI